MLFRSARSRIAEWLRRRATGYTHSLVALALNVPFMFAALSRYPHGLTWASVAGLYAVMVFAGYYVLAAFLLLTVAFLLTGMWRRVFVFASTAILTLMLYYFVVDGIVYRLAKMHIDAFWLEYLLTTFSGIGIGRAQIAGSIILLAVIAGCNYSSCALRGRSDIARCGALAWRLCA